VKLELSSCGGIPRADFRAYALHIFEIKHMSIT